MTLCNSWPALKADIIDLAEPAGTAFADLPEHRRCPGCDNAREQFMVLGEQGASTVVQQRPPHNAGVGHFHTWQRDLFSAYISAAERMRKLLVDEGFLVHGARWRRYLGRCSMPMLQN